MRATGASASSRQGGDSTQEEKGKRTSLVCTCGQFCTERDEHDHRVWPELTDIPLRQLVAGAFHCVAVTTRGEVYTWGNQFGRDQSNGNLLGHGPHDPMDGSQFLRCVPPKQLNATSLGPVAEVACSTYSTAAVTVDGRVFTWGDSDGGALGHSNLICNQPQWLTSLRGQHMSHASLSYTNGAVASDQGRCYVWGGNYWQGGIAEGRESNGPTEVVWGGVPSCYRCSSIALSHRHGYLIFRKHL
mmetsp:Transcript_28130/g.68272  ORF Transcript_28130/g.68272 Transcript_28130/m.68272 type:complete len:244 (+) Transcript_28130:1180-1911(+)